MAFLNRCIFNPTAGGLTDWTVSSAVTGYVTPATAGMIDGVGYSYSAQSNDLTQWEIGYGNSSSSGTVLARTTIVASSSGTSKVNFTNPPQVMITGLSRDFLWRMSGNTTFYVRSDGSDSNNGLANTAAGAFLTLAHAIDVVTSDLDFDGSTITIKLGESGVTWTEQFALDSPWSGGGNLIFDGGGNTLSVSTSHSINITCVLPAPFTVQNMTVICSAGSSSCLRHAGVGTVQVGSGMTFGSAVNYHIFSAAPGAIINCVINYTISGNCTAHVVSSGSGSFVYIQAAVTISPAITVSQAFAYCNNAGLVLSFGSTFTAAVTGQRYLMNNGGVIDTLGGGANYYPGTVAGPATLSTNGFYG